MMVAVGLFSRYPDNLGHKRMDGNVLFRIQVYNSGARVP